MIASSMRQRVDATTPEWTLEDTIHTPSPGEMANQCGVTWPDLIDPRVRTAVGELYDRVFGAFGDRATIRRRRLPSDGSKQVQRRLPPEEVEELVATYLAGATVLALAGKHSIHRTTVSALLECHQVTRRGRVLTPDHIERAVSSYASGRSCASIGKEIRVNPRPPSPFEGRRGHAQAWAPTSLKWVLSHLAWR